MCALAACLPRCVGQVRILSLGLRCVVATSPVHKLQGQLRWTRVSCSPQARWKFSYRPNAWHKEFPIARTGLRQSPIDIDPAKATYDEKLVENPLIIDYRPESYMTIMNTGLSFQANCKQHSELRGGPLPNTFRLEQFHFHWGSKDSKGSEHRVYGNVFPAEMHLVHWNSDKYGNYDEAMDKPDGLAVMAVFLKVGMEHRGFATLTENMENVKLKNKRDTVVCFSPFSLLPANTSHYWTYLGSQTMPPLLESVTWIVLKEATAISKEQIKILREISCDKHGDHIVNNYRPPMPLGHRSLHASFKSN